MKSYPKMQYFDKGIHGSYIYAFDKLDGSNIRCEWSRKRGWYKFGTKNVMIDEKSEFFGDAVTIFLNKYGEDLPKVFKKHYPNIESFVVFCEYLGENSFAGYHIENDPKDVVLFDVNAYRKGFIGPRDFIRNFGHLHIPDIIYQGEYNSQLIRDIRNNIWGLREGVVCKGTLKTKKEADQVWMVKIKSTDWLERVRNKLGEIALLEELNGNMRLLD